MTRYVASLFAKMLIIIHLHVHYESLNELEPFTFEMSFIPS